uniref:Big-1 domain-containing protein n=1 Tax=Solibacter usitatus (strain Ellin6076) TaxID=234267 RepID=Q01XJ2_SOLUE
MIVPGIARPLCAILAALLAAPLGSAQAPSPVPQSAAPQSIPSALKIIVLEGNNAFNSIPLGRPVTPIVEVRDDNDFPVEGATVVFTLPSSGPSGVFPGTRTSLTTRSDARGQAAAPFMVTGTPGKFRIQVTATIGNRKGETFIDQTNTTSTYIGRPIVKKPWYKKWQTWAIVGAAAGVGLGVGLTRGGGSSSSSGVTITSGGPVFGGPH